MAQLKNSWRRIAANCRQLGKNRTAVLLTLVGAVLALSARPVITDALRQKMHFALDVQVEENRCLPHSFYFVRLGRPEGGLTHGMYVEYIASGGLMGHALDGLRIIKIVAALPGDRVRVDDTGISINGKLWGPLGLSSRLDVSGLRMLGDNTVPEGKALLLGTMPGSYDGRYWGFLDQDQIIGQAWPIF
jgi:conjugal transfer pilin signal peptidase TrbI